MGDPKTQEWWQGIGKGLLYIVWVSIGVAVSIAMEAEQVIMSRKKVIIRVLFSVCAGAMASFACIGLNFNSGFSAIIVPCSTIIGQEFFKWLIKNWRTLPILSQFLGKNANKKDNDN